MDKPIINSHKDLIVWQKAIILTTSVYKITSAFPQKEVFGITSQMRRAVVSVPLNIAEGYGRESLKSYVNFLKIARGSLLELDTCIIICLNLDYINKEIKLELEQNITEINKMLNKLISVLNQKIKDIEQKSTINSESTK